MKSFLRRRSKMMLLSSLLVIITIFTAHLLLTKDRNSAVSRPPDHDYANSFNRETLISYELKRGGRTTLEIYSENGELIRRLIKMGEERGHHAITWDGKNERGVPVATGAYLYRVYANGKVVKTKMMILR